MLLATMAIAIATPMMVSVLPALVASRRRLPSASSGVVRSREDRSGYGARDLMVFAEVALASVLVVTTLMVFRLFAELQSVQPAYDPTPVAIVTVGADVRSADLAALIEQARAVPGIVAVATIKGPRDTVLVRGLLAMFSMLALTLAGGGIFAVSRHSVLQRTRELGIRLALGATASGLVRMVMGREMKLIGVAVALAAAGTLAVTRFAFVELLRLSVKDPFFWLGILLALGVVSAVACYTAVRGISRLEPMDALRDL